MPLFEENGTRYNVSDKGMEQFVQDHPTATTMQERDGKQYRVSAKGWSRFITDFPEENQEPANAVEDAVQANQANLGQEQDTNPYHQWVREQLSDINPLGWLQSAANSFEPEQQPTQTAVQPQEQPQQTSGPAFGSEEWKAQQETKINQDVANFDAATQAQLASFKQAQENRQRASKAIGGVAEIGQRLNPETGEIEKLYTDNMTGAVYGNKATAQMSRQTEQNRQQRLGYANGQMANLNEQLAAAQAQLDMFNQNIAENPYASMGGHRGGLSISRQRKELERNVANIKQAIEQTQAQITNLNNMIDPSIEGQIVRVQEAREATLRQIEALRKRDEERWREYQRENPQLFIGQSGRGRAYSKPPESERIQALRQAVRNYDKAIVGLQNQQKRENHEKDGFWDHTKQGLNSSAWERNQYGFWQNTGELLQGLNLDYGISDLNRVALMLHADEIPEHATEGEKAAYDELMQSQAVLQDVNNLYGQYTPAMGRYGDIFAQMPGFMVPFITTAGWADALKIGDQVAIRGLNKMFGKGVSEKLIADATANATKEAVEKGLTQEATDALVAQAVAKATRQGLEAGWAKEAAEKGIVASIKDPEIGAGKTATTWLMRGLGQAADDVVMAGIRINTVAAPSTVAQAIDYRLGDVVLNDDGTYSFEKEKSWGDALSLAEMDNLVEFYSEALGFRYGRLLSLGRWGQVADNVGLKRLSNFLSRANASTYHKFWGDLSKLLGKAGVNNITEEVAEEYAGQYWRSILGLETAYTTDEEGNRVNLAFTGQFHGDIWGGMVCSIGLMSAMKHGWSAGRYYNLNHKLNKADRVASELLTRSYSSIYNPITKEREQRFVGVGWGAIKYAIDNTSNANMGLAAEAVIVDPTLTKTQKEAIMNYMTYLIEMRGYNLAGVRGELPPEQTEGLTADQTAVAKMLQGQATANYISGYESDGTPQDAVDARVRRDMKRDALVRLLGEDVVNQIDQDPMAMLRAMASDKLRYGDNEMDAVIDYINAKMAVDGMIQRETDDMDDQVAQSDAMIDQRTNFDTGKVQEATMNDNRKVYVVRGNVVRNEDGTINTQASDDTLVVRDDQTGQLEMVAPSALLSVDSEQDPTQLKEAAANTIRQQAMEQAQAKLNNQLPIAQGDTFNYVDADGNPTRVVVVPNADGVIDNGDGTINVTADGQNVFPISIQFLRQQAEQLAQQHSQDYDEAQQQQKEQEQQEEEEQPQAQSKRKGERQIARAMEQAQEAAEKGDMMGLANAVNNFDSNVRNGAEATEEERATMDAYRQQLADAGYEVVDMMYQPYDEGLRTEADFVSDDSLPDGVQVITSVRQPQVNKDGKMVQSSKIVVTQGTAKGAQERADLKKRAHVAQQKQARGEALTRQEQLDIAAQKQIEAKDRAEQQLQGKSRESAEETPQEPTQAQEAPQAQAAGEVVEEQPAPQEEASQEDNAIENNEESQASAELREATQQPKSALEQIPVDEQGNPIYEQSTPQLAWDALVKQTEGDENEAQAVADDMVKDKEKALKEAQKEQKKPTQGATPAEKIAERKARADAVAQAQADLDFWRAVAGEQAQRTTNAARATQERASTHESPQTAREHGYRTVNGQRVNRQENIPAIKGKPISLRFATRLSGDVMQDGRVAIIDADQLQPSHLDGKENPSHFLNEAQPKDRKDKVSRASATKMAQEIRPEEITATLKATEGAPVVNTRGEVIQGNNRSAALKQMWEDFPEKAAEYKEYLKEHAAEFGLTAEQIDQMKNPILVSMVDVDDDKAIELGQYTAADNESGGNERIQPVNTANLMINRGAMQGFVEQLLRSNDENESLSDIIRRNGGDVLRWMARNGFISENQLANAIDENGRATAAARDTLLDILTQRVIGGDKNLQALFEELPLKARKVILTVASRIDTTNINEAGLLEEIRDSIRAFHDMSQDKTFAETRSYEGARNAVETYRSQTSFDDTGNIFGEQGKIYSNLATELAALYKSEAQASMQGRLNNLLNLLRGIQEDMFGDLDTTPRTLAQAVKELFNIDYNGQFGSGILGSNATTNTTGRQGSSGTTESSERNQGEERSEVDRGGVEGNSEQGGGVNQEENSTNNSEVSTNQEENPNPENNETRNSAEETPNNGEVSTNQQQEPQQPLTQGQQRYNNFVEKVRDLVKKLGNVPVRMATNRQELLAIARQMDNEAIEGGKRGGLEAQIRQLFARGRTTRGFVNNGQVVIFTEGIYDLAEGSEEEALQTAREVLAHEVIAHVGLRQLMDAKDIEGHRKRGSSFKKFCDDVFKGMSAENRSRFLAYHWNTNMSANARLRVLDNVLADDAWWQSLAQEQKEAFATQAQWDDLTLEQKAAILGNEQSVTALQQGAADEYVASLAEKVERGEELTDQERSVWQRIIDAIKRFFGAETTNGLTPQQIAQYLQESREFLQNEAQNGGEAQLLGEEEERFSVEEQERQEAPQNEDLFARAERIAQQYEQQYENERRFSSVVYPRVLARDAYERRMRSSMFQTVEAMQDSMRSLFEATKIILGKRRLHIEDLPEYQNAYIGENALSSVNQAEAEMAARQLFAPLLQEIARLAPSEAENRTLIDYMMAKHGLERNRYMAERNAQRAFADYQRANPNGGRTLADFVGEARLRDYAGLTALTGTDNVVDAEAAAEQMVADYESKHNTTVLWQRTRAVTDAILQKQYDSGLMTRASFDHIMGMYQNYIPLRGFDETTSDEVYAYLMSRGSGMASVDKAAKGRESKADDPIANLQAMMENAIMRGNRNVLVKQRFMNFAMNHPSDLISISDLWLERNDKGEWIPQFPDIKDGDTPAQVTQKCEQFEQDMQAKATADPDRYVKQSDRPDIPYKVVTKEELKEHQVIVSRGGRDYILTVNGNPRLAQAINGKTNPDNDNFLGERFQRVLGSINRALSAFYTTRNPDFIISNFFRDMLYSNTMTHIKEKGDYARHYNVNYARTNPAMMNILLTRFRRGTLNMGNEMDRLFYEFMAGGGETGYASVRDIDAHKNEIQRELKKYAGRMPVGKALDYLGARFDELNRSVELCARFAAFVTSRQMGRTIGRAVYDAKEVSVNFNKKGAGGTFYKTTGQTRIGNWAAAISAAGRLGYVFWNAGMQGMTNFGRQFGRHPAKAIAAAATMYTLGALVSHLGNMGGGDGDDDDNNAYWNLPDYLRRTNILFRTGNYWISIPLPIEFRAFYGMGELMTSLMYGREYKDGWGVASEVASQLTQVLPLDFLEGAGGFKNFLPSSVKPLFEAVLFNVSWNGTPLQSETPWNQKRPQYTKAWKSANQYIVGMAEWLNRISGGNDKQQGKIDVSPAKIEYMLNGYFGGVFNTINELTKMGEMAIGKRDFDPGSVMLLTRILRTGNTGTKNRGVENEYWRISNNADELKRKVREYEDALNSPNEKTREHAEKEGYQKALDKILNSMEWKEAQVFEDYRKELNAANRDVKNATDDEERAENDMEFTKLKRGMLEAVRQMRQNEKKKKAEENEEEK